jgi:tetratricopeptide (TPR) repeat protein
VGRSDQLILRAPDSGLSKLVALLVALTVTVCACSSGARRKTRPVALPELSRVDPSVQRQVREQYEALQRANTNATPDPELATAFGQYGMVLQAAEFFDAAEPALLNAEALAPAELRWPYYLANLYKSRGETDKAETSYKRALALRPDDLATLIWLGRLHLDQGRPDEAEPLFAKAHAIAPRIVAATAGLGSAALARRDYAGAVRNLEEALALDPEAESLHAPLAAAYRGLGQIEKAQPHLRQWRNADVLLPDPLQQEMDLLLESGLSYELRGVRAFEARDWKAAAEFFRRGMAIAHDDTPLARSLHHKLGTALYLMGDAAAAREQFEAVIARAPASGIDEATAKAHYSLALLMAQSGQDAPAIAHFASAVTYQPNYVEAHLAYGDALRRTGKANAALAQYEEAIQLNPRSVPARLGYAMTLVTLGRSREARDGLVELTMRDPDRLEYQMALARVLAAAPDDGVRDPRRSLQIIDEHFRQQRAMDVGETIAMALAALGEFQQAVEIQRGVLSAAEKGGKTAAAARMSENLRLYEHRQPCRHPWPDDQSVMTDQNPGSQISDAPRLPDAQSSTTR